MAAAGLVYCSWNAGAIRLLVPPSAEHFISEMHTGHEVLITQGPWRRERRPHALELLWEDESDTPFFLLIAEAQFDRLFDENAVGRRVACHVYKRGLLDTPELVGIWPARLRLAPSLPHLKR